MDEERASLIDRAMLRLSSRAPSPSRSTLPGIEWRVAAALAALIALGPLLTIIGAGVIGRGVRDDTARLRAQAEPRIAAIASDREARVLLRDAVREAPVSVWLDRVAAMLPDEARVARMARAEDGALALEVTAPDPDLVRAAIRRDPLFAGFRERGQRRAGAMILITYRRDR